MHARSISWSSAATRPSTWRCRSDDRAGSRDRRVAQAIDDGTDALRGIDLRVPAGGIFALLGRNGSGKTTAVRIMVGLTSSTSGTVTVSGHDMASERERVQARIGVTLQEAALDEVLTGREFLRFVARVQGRGRAAAAARTDELLELFGLQQDRGVRWQWRWRTRRRRRGR